MSQSSALPATTPSDDRAVDRFVARVLADPFCASVTEHALVLEVKALRDEIDRLRGISPSEGSAPDTPEPEDDDNLANQVALQVLCRVFDDGVDVAMDEWRAFNAKGGFFWWARALGAFIRGRLDDQRVPPSAPDTKPDERLAEIRERLANGTPGLLNYVLSRLSSSPPEGEDTTPKPVAYHPPTLDELHREAIRFLDNYGAADRVMGTSEEAHAALFDTSPLTYNEAVAAVLIILTFNGVAAWHGDGTGILAQAFVHRSRDIDSARAAIPPQDRGHE